MNNEDNLNSIVSGGLLLLAIATAPVWLPTLVGIKPKHCECGAKIEKSGIIPGCRCYY